MVKKSCKCKCSKKLRTIEDGKFWGTNCNGKTESFKTHDEAKNHANKLIKKNENCSVQIFKWN